MKALATTKLVEVTLVLAIDTDLYSAVCGIDHIHTDGVPIIQWSERDIEATYKGEQQ